MSRWHPLPICAAVDENGVNCCIILYDRETTEFIAFEQRCQVHQAMSDRGIPDTELYDLVRLESMHWAVARETLGREFPQSTVALSFAKDRALALRVVDAAHYEPNSIRARVAEAILAHPIVLQLMNKAA